MKRFWFKKGLMMVVFFVLALVVFSAVVMALWNAILPGVLGVKAVTFGQAMGLLVLSKILFSGFGQRGGWRNGGARQWQKNIREKFGNMSAEEREKFREEWRSRCSGRDWRTGGRNTTNQEFE